MLLNQEAIVITVHTLWSVDEKTKKDIHLISFLFGRNIFHIPLNPKTLPSQVLPSLLDWEEQVGTSENKGTQQKWIPDSFALHNYTQKNQNLCYKRNMWHTRKKNMERNVKTSTFISACIIKAYQNHVSIIANFLLWGMRKVSLPILSLCPTGLTASRSCKKGRRSRKPFFYPLLKGADLS